MSPRGLTGLSSTFHLSRKFPKAQIVLLEKEARLGGWVRSERVELPQIGSSVLLEAGPRTLRPNSMAVLELIHLLKLENEIITVPKTAPPAKARFLYIPKSDLTPNKIAGLQRLPSSILSLLSSPLLPTLLAAIIPEPFRRQIAVVTPPTRASISVFSSFGETFARTFGSALVHGIYATDSRKLSVRAAFPTIWEAEERGRGSIVRGLLMPAREEVRRKVQPWKHYQSNACISVYSFKNGMETLTKALEKSLLSSNNVSIMTNTHLSGLKKSEDRSIEIYHSHGETLHASHVVSALPLPVLHNLISTIKPTSSPSSTENPSTTVRVVNFIFPCPPKDVHPEGFGLLQQSSHTKLTMMTGGPYPQSPLPPYLTSSESQMTPPFIRSLLDQLKVQLGRDIPEPIYWRIWNNEACIPTLLPGHLDRMEELKSHLGLSSKPALAQGSETGWDSRLAVIGAGVGGVSVGDCIEAGRQVGRNWGESINFNDGLFWFLLLILNSG
ncbi:hypothetical protein CPB84DRAFT_1771770 [Gymnopilus junonius]|uniref:Protoporphyrinogen oxidase n=1 Tax=Gymnopilus junonius TaxID=109634 RepID=A0A9P5NSP9_GYMJU|nr:hypothetical protein CPB84DRAFT_1771770 [Gymnopilus junonius]